jgi:predicted DNA-binding transcriptional regulator AlpA
MSAAVAPVPTSDRKLVRLNKTVERLGISRATLYREMERDPLFPKPVRVRGAILFVADEIDAYIERLAQARGR